MRCDPFVELYIGTENVWRSEAKDDTALIEPNYTYKTKKPIKKDSRIKILVWDENLKNHRLIHSKEGSVTDWLNERNVLGSRLGMFQNSIETFVMWKDVYAKE